MTVRSPAGICVARRAAGNIVLRQGAAIVAGLFAGSDDMQPINQIQVGFGTETASAELTALTPPPAEAGVPVAALRTPLAADSYEIVLDRPSFVQVLIRAVFKPTVELADVTEAGLLAGDRLYNQVIFEPVTLRVGQDVTFFWQIDFPFGH